MLLVEFNFHINCFATFDKGALKIPIVMLCHYLQFLFQGLTKSSELHKCDIRFPVVVQIRGPWACIAHLFSPPKLFKGLRYIKLCSLRAWPFVTLGTSFEQLNLLALMILHA